MKNNLSNNTYDLSIVIPTKNRVDTASVVINGILSIENSITIQVIVMDNSDKDTLKEKIDLNNCNLVYVYDNSRMTFSQNFARGLNYCRGRYVCYIGDDDYISSNIDCLIHYMDKNNILSCGVLSTVSYYWEGVHKEGKVLQVSSRKWKITKIDVKLATKKLLENGGQGYLQFGLPKLYHGVISKKVIDDMKKDNLNIFDSLSPDIFNSFLLTKYLDYSYLTNYPFTIPGSSAKSASGKSINKRHIGALNEAPHFFGWDNYCWHTKIPAFFSVETIWAESLLFAIDYCGTGETINYKRLYEICFYNHPEYCSFLTNDEIGFRISFRLRLKRRINKLSSLVKRLFNRVLITFKVRKYVRIVR